MFSHPQCSAEPHVLRGMEVSAPLFSDLNCSGRPLSLFVQCNRKPGQSRLGRAFESQSWAVDCERDLATLGEAKLVAFRLLGRPVA